MRKIEASGRTVEEAVEFAARELGIDKDAVEYEVIERGSKGFLGLGQAPTVISAWASEVSAKEQPEPTTTAIEDFYSPGTEKTEGIEQESACATAKPIETYDPLAFAVVKLLQRVMEAMNLKGNVVITRVDDDEVAAEITGPDVSMLIGRQGHTLDALQYIVGIGANKTAERKKRVIIDCCGYRQRHREILERKAREYAAAVKAEGKEAVLEPQSARDRRIIHMALADDPDVYTYSEGEGDERHVVISPKK